MILTNELFHKLVKSASMAPSSDNLQPWEFRKVGDSIELYLVQRRLLKVDVDNMFSWISLGAALQNMEEQAASQGLKTTIEYGDDLGGPDPAAVLTFHEYGGLDNLSSWIPLRTTNRSAFEKRTLEKEVLDAMLIENHAMDVGLHYLSDKPGLQSIADIDRCCSRILLEHKDFFDAFFDTLLFTKEEIEEKRLGMDIKSLDIPLVFAFIAQRLKRLNINRILCRLGMGKVIAGILAKRLLEASGLLLITIKERSPREFIQGGRAMEKLWLKASSLGLSVHPYGVIPQYFTMAVQEPERFLAGQAKEILSHEKSFYDAFPQAKGEFPLMMLRIGYSAEPSVRTTIRLRPRQIIRS